MEQLRGPMASPVRQAQGRLGRLSSHEPRRWLREGAVRGHPMGGNLGEKSRSTLEPDCVVHSNPPIGGHDFSFAIDVT